MSEAAEQPESRSEAERRASRVRVSALVVAAAAFVVVLWGGYGHHWPWTGISGRTATLWDWLHLLLLPVAVAVLPLWLSRRTRITRRQKSLGYVVLAAFGVIVLVGYTVPWGWTGFVGNRLWDWLELIALPLAVALTPIMRELRTTWNRRYTRVALAGSVVFVAIVLGGYTVPWRWTGFQGNTLWNWMHLLLLPLLLPTVVVPALMPIANAGVTVLDESEPSAEPGLDPGSAETGPAQSPAKSPAAGA
jgi:hypothetical protein